MIWYEGISLALTSVNEEQFGFSGECGKISLKIVKELLSNHS